MVVQEQEGGHSGSRPADSRQLVVANTPIFLLSLQDIFTRAARVQTAHTTKPAAKFWRRVGERAFNGVDLVEDQLPAFHGWCMFPEPLGHVPSNVIRHFDVPEHGKSHLMISTAV